MPKPRTATELVLLHQGTQELRPPHRPCVQLRFADSVHIRSMPSGASQYVAALIAPTITTTTAAALAMRTILLSGRWVFSSGTNVGTSCAGAGLTPSSSHGTEFVGDWTGSLTFKPRSGRIDHGCRHLGLIALCG